MKFTTLLLNDLLKRNKLVKMPLKKLPYATLDALIKKHISANEDEHTLQLIKLLSSAKKRSCLTKDELIEICYWKSARSIRLIVDNHSQKVKKITQSAFAAKSEEEKMSLLLALRGVGIPMASAILMLINPIKYCVIDIRVWEVLFATKTVTTNKKGTNFKINEWCQLLSIVRQHSKKNKVSARTIERSIFETHKIYQVGPLYKNSKNKILSQRGILRPYICSA